MHIRIGTRGSKLAIIQANKILQLLKSQIPQSNCEIVIIKTTGDILYDKPLTEIGGKSIFLKEIEEKLLNGEIDLGVHSLKDMTSELPHGLSITCVLNRDDPRDALISVNGYKLNELPIGATIGTGSARRSALLKLYRPDLKILVIRGNIDTRIAMVQSGEIDAIILSACGLIRMQMQNLITEYLDTKLFIPSIGQGVIAVEQVDLNMHYKLNPNTINLNTINANILPNTQNIMPNILGNALSKINDWYTFLCISAERGFMKEMAGNCKVPLAGFAQIDRETNLLTLNTMFQPLLLEMQPITLSSSMIRITEIGVVRSVDDANQIGINAAIKIKKEMP